MRFYSLLYLVGNLIVLSVSSASSSGQGSESDKLINQSAELGISGFVQEKVAEAASEAFKDVPKQIEEATLSCLNGLSLSILDPNNPSLGGYKAKSVIFMVTGILLAFSGKKALHSILFVLGVLAAGYGAFWGSSKIDGFIDLQKNEVAVYVGVAMIAFVGGFLAVWFLKLGVVILGAVLGASVSTIFLSLNLFDAKDSSTIIFTVTSLAFAALAYLMSDTIIIVATAVTGALIFMVGLDFLTKKGFAEYVISIRLGQELTPPNEALFPILCSLAIIALFGIIVQHKFR